MAMDEKRERGVGIACRAKEEASAGHAPGWRGSVFAAAVSPRLRPRWQARLIPSHLALPLLPFTRRLRAARRGPGSRDRCPRLTQGSVPRIEAPQWDEPAGWAKRLRSASHTNGPLSRSIPRAAAARHGFGSSAPRLADQSPRVL